ncbi:unnamed protein product [Gordionus sp. m RMFG-2023]
MKLNNFFHPNLTGIEAVKLLLEKGSSGDFLIRPSEKAPDSFTLSVRQGMQVVHINIINNGEYYSIGSDTKEGFATLTELLQFFSKSDPCTPKIKERHGNIIYLDRVFPCNDLCYQR